MSGQGKVSVLMVYASGTTPAVSRTGEIAHSIGAPSDEIHFVQGLQAERVAPLHKKTLKAVVVLSGVEPLVERIAESLKGTAIQLIVVATTAAEELKKVASIVVRTFEEALEALSRIQSAPAAPSAV